MRVYACGVRVLHDFEFPRNIYYIYSRGRTSGRNADGRSACRAIVLYICIMSACALTWRISPRYNALVLVSRAGLSCSCYCIYVYRYYRLALVLLACSFTRSRSVPSGLLFRSCRIGLRCCLLLLLYGVIVPQCAIIVLMCLVV